MSGNRSAFKSRESAPQHGTIEVRNTASSESEFAELVARVLAKEHCDKVVYFQQ